MFVIKTTIWLLEQHTRSEFKTNPPPADPENAICFANLINDAVADLALITTKDDLKCKRDF